MKLRRWLGCILVVIFCFTILPFPVGAATKRDVNPVISYLSFRDASLKDVLYLLAQKSHLNIILDEDSMYNKTTSESTNETITAVGATKNIQKESKGTEKKITLNLSNIHLYDALDLIVSSAGLTYTNIGGTIVVGEKNHLGRNFNALTTERIKLQYADAFKVKDTLVGLGIIDYNNIFVYGELNNEKNLTSQEKSPENGTSTSTTNNNNNSNTNNQSSSNSGNSAANLTVDRLTERHITDTDKADSLPANVLIIRDTLANLNQAKAVIKSLDQPAPKIMVEAKVVEINETGMKQLGVDWITDSNKEKGILTTTTYNEIRSKTYSRGLLSFNAAIKAQIDRGNAKVLSSPKISTLEGNSAFIYVGDKIPYVSSRDEDTETERVTTEVSFLSAGVTLEILPILTENKDIQLKIYSEVSSIKDWKTIDNVDYPIPSMRQAQTITRVKAGETIVLGGLISDEDSKDISKLPLLGDIPILKHLFSWSSHEKNRSEVVISLTPYLVN